MLLVKTIVKSKTCSILKSYSVTTLNIIINVLTGLIFQISYPIIRLNVEHRG